ncbi:MAG: hypothetical protein AAGK97_05720, partial [Bacteroidota bacterium]
MNIKNLMLLVICSLPILASTQNVGIGTNNPDEKLHVAGNLKVDSSIQINRLEIVDSLGNIRMILDANSGRFEMWDNDSLWLSTEVNSPKRDTVWGKDKKTYIVIAMQDGYEYKNYYKIVGGGVGELQRITCNAVDRAAVQDGEATYVHKVYRSGCQTYEFQGIKNPTIQIPDVLTTLCGPFDFSGFTYFEAWYDCPGNKLRRTRWSTKSGVVEFFYDENENLISTVIKTKGKKINHTPTDDGVEVLIEKAGGKERYKFKSNDATVNKEFIDGNLKYTKEVSDTSGNKVTTTVCPQEGKMKIKMNDGLEFELDLCGIIKTKIDAVAKQEVLRLNEYIEKWGLLQDSIIYRYLPGERRIHSSGYDQKLWQGPNDANWEKILIDTIPNPEFVEKYNSSNGNEVGSVQIPDERKVVKYSSDGMSIETILNRDTTKVIYKDDLDLDDLIEQRMVLENNPSMNFSNPLGPINFDIEGLISKLGGTFKIDHPLDPDNKYLYHSFVESPDMMNIYNGNVITNDNGIA